MSDENTLQPAPTAPATLRFAPALILLAVGAVVAFTYVGGEPPTPEPTRAAATPPGAESVASPEGYAPIDWRETPLTRGVEVPEGFVPYDPIRTAAESLGQVENAEAGIPVQCYTATDGVSNPCYVCHTERHDENWIADAALQLAYAFSDVGQTNHWDNLFIDRSEAIAAISDDEALAWVREDNYEALRRSMALLPEDRYVGYRPDLDFAAGFDAQGFAKDGSGWRAYRYKPFTGQFWPTNGNTDDVLIRLAPKFRTKEGAPDRDVALANLALLEAAFASDPSVPAADVRWPMDPVNEAALGVDLDGDGRLGTATVLAGLPPRFVGDASDHALRRAVYPERTEFLHTVRYADPESPTFMSQRIKEVRYMLKLREHSDDRMHGFYAREDEERDEGALPLYNGHPLVGWSNKFGWRLLGWLEDAEGRLRLQTHEEGQYCMGCHSNIGVTLDQTFSFARKIPGPEGWAYQSLEGMPDVPQLGRETPEVLEYFGRVQGGDELPPTRRCWGASGTRTARFGKSSCAGRRRVARTTSPISCSPRGSAPCR